MRNSLILHFQSAVITVVRKNRKITVSFHLAWKSKTSHYLLPLLLNPLHTLWDIRQQQCLSISFCFAQHVVLHPMWVLPHWAQPWQFGARWFLAAKVSFYQVVSSACCDSNFSLVKSSSNQLDFYFSLSCILNQGKI